MFDVEYKGANAVVFATKKTRVVYDPGSLPNPAKPLVGADDIVVATEDRFVGTITPRLLFDGPGEYETADVSLRGVAARRHIDEESSGMQSTVYRMVVGGVRVAVIGNIAPALDEQQLEEIGVVDIVVVPVGGHGYTLDALSAAKLVRQLEPKAVIPVHYADTVVAYEVPQDEVDGFIQELGAAVIDAGTKWKVKEANLPGELSVVMLARGA